MSNRNRTPPELLSYLVLPPDTSLILLTSTLGCSASWLTARFVGSVLGKPGSGEEACNVVLVSWTEGVAFWKDEVRRSTGLEVSRIAGNSSFVFLDCLSDALTPTAKRGNAIADIEKITVAMGTISPDGKTMLVLDGPDVLLASGVVKALEFNRMLLKLRSQTHAIVLSCSAPLPVQHIDSVPTPIELEHAAFIVQQAHMARLVMSVRELQTGAARDVSGVLRVTRGDAVYERDEHHGEVKDMEALYLVQRDGVVKVLER